MKGVMPCLAMAFLACGVALPIPSARDAERVGSSVERLTAARELYASKCGSCHAPVAPSTRRAEAWPESVDEMRQRAHIDEAERAAILRYLTAYARP